MTVSELREILQQIEDHYPCGGDCIVSTELAGDTFYDGEEITGWRYSKEIHEAEEKSRLFLLRE